MAESKSVTLYLTEDTIDKLNAFAEVTVRSKSQAAELMILHGIANYDIKAAAAKKVEKPRKATAANTKVKAPPAVKAPRGRKPNGSASNVKPAAKKPVAKKPVAKKPAESATARRRKAAETAKRQAAAA